MVKKIWFKTSLTVRTAFVLLMVLSGGIAVFISAKSAMAANLKAVSVISGDVLTLGDIFEGVTRNADYVIGPAPQPGQDMILNARTLYRIAVAMDLPWRPATSYDQIVIRREATVVPYEDVEQVIKSALSEKGVKGDFKLTLNSAKPNIVLPQDMPKNVEVSSMNFNPQKDYFQASLVAPSVENPLRKVTVSGMVERLAKVPVLRENLQNGDIIGERDIDFIDVPQNTLQNNIVTDMDDIIGMTPRRMGYAGKYIIAGTLEKPQLVERGEKVTIIFNEGPLTLTANGKAMQSGAMGESIRIVNTNSNREVDAIVTGSEQVTVQ